MTTPSRARFSVVIPAFNESGHLAETLSSLDRQDFSGPYEVIVVDNNSTDDTARIAQAYGARVISEPRPGVCFARQAGTEASQGEIVVSTDADTTFPTSWLSTIDNAFSERATCVAVAGPCKFTGAPWWGTIYPIVLFNVISFLALVTGRVFYVTATNIAFKRAVWEGYDTRLTQGGDELDLLRRLRRRGKVTFLRGNATMTSARRLRKGLVYNIFVSFLYYYVLAYVLNRLTHRTLLRTAPAFRSDGTEIRGSLKVRLGIAMFGLCLLLVAVIVATPFGRALVPDIDGTMDAFARLV
ncbi:MAG: glycosyltransferase family 2 protein [Acidimicrobiales bacterium]